MRKTTRVLNGRNEKQIIYYALIEATNEYVNIMQRYKAAFVIEYQIKKNSVSLG